MRIASVRVAAFVFLLALGVRLAGISYWQHVELSADSTEYLSLAYNLRVDRTFGFGGHHAWGENGRWPSGPGEPSIARAPGYPAMIAALWGNPATSPLGRIRFVQAVLGAATAALAGSLGGPAAGIGMAFAPMSVYYTALIMSEALCTFLMLVGVFLWAQARFWWAGAILGLATLTKPLTLPLFLVLALFGILGRRRKYLAIGVGALAMVAPWMARNYLVSGKLVPINAYGWSSNIFLSTIEVPYGSGNPWPRYVADPDMRRILDSGASDVDAEKEMFRVGIRRIRSHPAVWLWARIKNYPRAFLDTGTYLSGLLPQRLIKAVLIAGNLLFLLLALYGFRREDDYIWLVLVYCFAAQFPSAGGDRYLLPVVPLMMVAAGHGLARLRARNRPEAAPSPAAARAAASGQLYKSNPA